MNCHASMPGPRGDRDWWNPQPPRNSYALWWVLLVVGVLVAAMAIGGAR